MRISRILLPAPVALVFVLCPLVGHLEASLKPVPPRNVISLDGTWEVAEGPFAEPPTQFPHTIPVPGLMDMATPPFSEVGRESPRRQAFWYRRTFSFPDFAVPNEVALLKIKKARYGSKVLLNGKVVGEHLPSFTPAILDVRPHLRPPGEPNELIIRVGAHRTALPPGMPTGWDFEKHRYIPGIYDSVELILTTPPYIANIQTVPDLKSGSVRIVAEIHAGPYDSTVPLRAEVRETRSGRRAGEGRTDLQLAAGEIAQADLTVPIHRPRLWSPEDPFLYDLSLHAPSDAVRTRFGMRSFGFEPGGQYALLNGKRYFLRGSNLTLYRFFEDSDRGDKPWRTDWVRRLHAKVKTMHWNSLRYCIGFPPDFWYDIADETGILIQDEFPIWTLGDNPEQLQTALVIPEYTAWMRERWNHPSVVIWDAQNESSIPTTGEAIRAVRHLDLSNRPWDNGWGEPQSPTDLVEAHPYLMITFFNPAWGNKQFTGMHDLAHWPGRPPLQPAQQKLQVPIIINEYAWLWLTREGYPTSLTGPVYERLLGPNATVPQRRQLFARLLAAKTEFWRAHRECAGVQHFCFLGYSRPGDQPRPEGGATSDHWLDVERLILEPYFERYVRDAFNPVGIMLDFWEAQSAPATTRTIRVHVFNDLERDWSGRVRLQIEQNDRSVTHLSQPVRLKGYERQILTFDCTLPTQPGRYTMIAQLSGPGPNPRSLRDLTLAVP